MTFSKSLLSTTMAAALLLSAAVGTVSAQEKNDAKLAAAIEVVILSNADKGFETVLPSLMQRTKALFIKTNPNLSKDIEEVVNEAGLELAGDQAELTSMVANSYAKHFSAEELNALVKFYKSPTGQKLAEKWQLIALETLRSSQVYGDRLSTRLVEAVRAKMKKRGHNL